MAKVALVEDPDDTGIERSGAASSARLPKH